MLLAVNPLVARLDQVAGSGALGSLVAGRIEWTPWAEIHHRAVSLSRVFTTVGGPYPRVAIVGESSPAIMTAIRAAWLAGGTVVAPARGGSVHSGGVVGTLLRAHLNSSMPDVIVISDLEDSSDYPADFGAVGAADGLVYGTWRPRVSPPRRSGHAVLQHTSGTVGRPKIAAVGVENLTANLSMIEARAQLCPDDIFMSWLPLFHDMGLIGFTALPMFVGSSLLAVPTSRFAAGPGRWANWLTDSGATVTGGPDSSYALLAMALRRGEGVDLSNLRIAFNGSEPISPTSFATFIEAASKYGMDPGAGCPAYGMAEASLVVSACDPGAGLKTHSIDGYRYAVVGRPLDGVDVRVAKQGNQPGAAGGSLEIRGPSVVSGYLDGSLDLTDDGWFRTGDMGQLLEDGSLVVTGRAKDVMKFGGRNVWPIEVEEVVAGVPGIRLGRVAAFSVRRSEDAREILVIAAEYRGASEAEVVPRIRRVVREATGVGPSDIVLLRRGTLPRTTSGKLRRERCRSLYEAGELVGLR